MIEQFIQHVFLARDVAHRAHWAARGAGSYAKHVALGEFYEALPGKLDAIVEVHQGAFGLVEDFAMSMPTDVPADMAAWLHSHAEWIADNRNEIADGCTPVENLIDDLLATYYQTVYKLTNLK